MKAVLLAAGMGLRLRPLTERVPKCLVPIGDNTLLGIWLRAFERHGIADVLVNVHHLPEAVLGYLAAYRGAVRVATVREPVLLGSLGTLVANRGFFSMDPAVLVCYADNLSDIDLSSLCAAHAADAVALTMATFVADDARRCGIAEVDARGLVVGFEEKPRHPRSHLANAGVYVCDSALFSEFPLRSGAVLDIGHHLLPTLVGRMRAFPTGGIHVDVGTPESYRRATVLYAEHRARFA